MVLVTSPISKLTWFGITSHLEFIGMSFYRCDLAANLPARLPDTKAQAR